MVSKKKIVLGIFLFILIASGVSFNRLYRQPLGPALELPTSTQPNPTLTTVPLQQGSAKSTATEVLPTSTSTPQPLCGGPAMMNILAIGSDGEAWIIEIKSSIADFRADQKWHEYRDYCDALLFAVAPDFPNEILPAETGLILADAYAGEIVRAAPRHPLSPTRRKALTIAVARTAAMRLLARIDPGAGIAME